MSFTTFGFGDSSYPKFNWAARKLHKRLEQLGAQEFYARGEADEQHDEGTDGAFLPWSRDLRKWLLQEYPLDEEVGRQPIPEDRFLEPKFVLEVDESGHEQIETVKAVELSLQAALGHDHVCVAEETAGFTQPMPPQRMESDSKDTDELEPAYAAPAAPAAPVASAIDSQIERLTDLDIASDPDIKPADSDIPPPLLLPIPGSHTLTLRSEERRVGKECPV